MKEPGSFFGQICRLEGFSLSMDSFQEKGKDEEEAIAEAHGNLKFLEEELKGNKFFGGEKIVLLDLALGCLTYFAFLLEEIIGLKIKESFPPGDELLAKCRGMPEPDLAAAPPK
ncbi:Glutathione S-transferase [Melia azedarach]|uniref:Glutathione S-transferase n=1 Tax=Melia azedarach TaxID=155640 RepID=A0ACC1YDG7_MELAZ|nr:Glutathione S-transferase [Melia azedarach]